VHAPLPAGYVEIDDVIKRSEVNPRRAAALVRARARLAEQMDASGPVTLASLRLRSGLSQAALADRIKNSQPSYSKIEAGKSDVHFSTMEKLSEALGVGIEEIARAIKETKGQQ
jgi:ribosome-binding protein aMBF1 (putative translation factor)